MNDISASNPYLTWLKNPEKKAPYPYRPSVWKEAWDEVYQTYRQACRTLKVGASVDVFETWVDAEKQLHVLSYWLEMVGGFAYEKDRELHQAIEVQVREQEKHMNQRRPEYRKLLTQLARRRSLTDDVRTRIRKVRDTLISYQKDILDLTQPLLAKQEETFLQSHPGLRLPSSSHLRGLKNSEITLSRQTAESRGVAGVVVERSGLVIESAIQTCVHRGVREAIWKMRQESRLCTDRAANRLFDARLSMAKKYGYESYAHHELSTRLHSNPNSLSKALENTLFEASNLYNETLAFLESYGRTKFDLDKIQDWDIRFLIDAMGKEKLGVFPDHEFPWSETLQKAVPELVGIVGWNVKHFHIQGRLAQTMFHWELERNGECHHLWIAPFQASPVKNLRVEGDADFFRTGPNNTLHSMIHLYKNHQSPGFDLPTLKTLAHEVGHVLHWLSMPASSGMTGGPTDIREVPSVLLEHYPQDPKVLKRWSTSSRHSLKFWEKQATRDDLDMIRMVFIQNFSGWLDLSVNINAPESLKQYVKDAPERFGIQAPHRDNTTWMGYAMWLDHGAADYIYHLSYAINHRLHPELGAKPKASRIAKQFQRLEEKVLSRSHLSPRVVRASWKALTGETLLQSLVKGGRTQTRAWTSKLRALKA